MAKPSAFNPNVSVNLLALSRARGNPSQPALEVKSGVKQSTIGRVLRGAASPMADTLYALAEALDCDMDLLYLQPSQFSQLLEAGASMRRKPPTAEGIGDAGDGVPIQGHAVMSESDLKFERLPGGARLLILGLNPGAYAMKAKGDGLSPVIRDGQFLIVEPARSINPGDMALFELHDGRHLLREVLFERDDVFAVDSVKTGNRETLPKDDVASVGVVAAITAASGVQRRPSM